MATQGSWTPPDLSGKVAVVAGATRGAGRGIARALGEAGATVYCTGRSSRSAPGGMERPETIEETADLVTTAGGTGIAVRVDHLDEAQVLSLVARVEREQGGLDILVNDIWGGDPDIEWGKRFWELDADRGWRVIETALRTHIITARHATPLLMARRGLLVEVTDGDHFAYRGNLIYDLVKTAIIRMAYTMAHELGPHGVTALAVTPGFLRSEAMLDLFGVTEANWRDAVARVPDYIASETPLYVGRAVSSLAADPDVKRRAGRVFASWTLADEYGFTDEDGARPHWGRHFRATYGSDEQPAIDDVFYRYWRPMRDLEEAIQQGQG
jgi:NAD(P)-dependent dehydrogenase (short-subunit alcohol dehydrogenase family)